MKSSRFACLNIAVAIGFLTFQRAWAQIPPARSSEPVQAMAPATAPRTATELSGQPHAVVAPVTGQTPPTTTDSPAPRPAEVPYIEGSPIPHGYVLQEDHMRGLIAGGATMLGVLYSISLCAAFSNDFKAENGWLAVPVVGPFGWLATRNKSTTGCNFVANGVDSSFSSSSCEGNDEPGNRVLMIIDGLGQVAGSAMLVAGLAITRKQLLRADQQEVIVAPYTSSTGSGLRIFGQF